MPKRTKIVLRDSEKQKKLTKRLEKARTSFDKVSSSLKVLVEDAVLRPMDSNTSALVTNTLTSILATSLALIPKAEKKYRKTKSSYDMYAYIAISDQARDVAKELRQFAEVEAQLTKVVHEVIIPQVQLYITTSFKTLKPLKEVIQTLPETQRKEAEIALVNYASEMNQGLSSLISNLRDELTKILMSK